ncbi:hypothetical protein CROQUDRAFT_671863 [Cronartium quercuum f. sp. fusiforme G11]|uniref:Uncharacterized protein n=1 Tax=Cronartium quercuum f. sp. fusiforme G11 TaxID=708437 RepID=A0A9P6TB56_9BASI|nr:hypothetical protein CROQUDRAFT_671863 [Cronartium quercuum f. sp. fusiforme G11]
MKVSQSFVVASLSMAHVGLSAPIPASPDPNLLSPRAPDHGGALSPRMNSRVYGRRSLSPMSITARNNGLRKASADMELGGGGGDDDTPPPQHHFVQHKPNLKPKERLSEYNKQDYDNGDGTSFRSTTHVQNDSGFRSHTDLQTGGSRSNFDSESLVDGGNLLDVATNLNIKRRSVPEKRDLSTILSGLSQTDLIRLQTEIAQLTNPQAAATSSENSDENVGYASKQAPVSSASLAPSKQAISPTVGTLSNFPFLGPPSAAGSHILDNTDSAMPSATAEALGSPLPYTNVSKQGQSLEDQLAQVTSSVPVAGGMLSDTMKDLPLSVLTGDPYGLGSQVPINTLTNSVLKGVAQPIEGLPIVGDPIKGVLNTILPANVADTSYEGDNKGTLESALAGLPIVGGPVSGVMSGLPLLDSLTGPGNPVSNILNTATGAMAGIPVVGGPLTNAVGSLPLSNLGKGPGPLPNILSTATSAVASIPGVGAPLAGAMNSLPLNDLTNGNPLNGLTNTAVDAMSGLPVVGGPLSSATGSLPLERVAKGGLVSGAISTVSDAVSGAPAVGGALSSAINALPLDSLTKNGTISGVGSMVTSAVGGLPVVGGPLSSVTSSLPYDSVSKALPLSLMAESPSDNSTLDSLAGYSRKVIPIPDDPASILAAAGGALPIQPSNSLDGVTLPNYLGGSNKTSHSSANGTQEAYEPSSPHTYVPSKEGNYGEKRLDLSSLTSAQGIKDATDSLPLPDSWKAAGTPVSDPLNSTTYQLPSPNVDTVSNPASQSPNSGSEAEQKVNSDLNGTPLVSQTGNDPVHSFLSNKDPGSVTNASPATVKSRRSEPLQRVPDDSIPPREEDMDPSKSSGTSADPTATSSDSKAPNQDFSSSSAPQSKTSSSRTNPFSGVFAPTYDPSFGVVNGQTPLAGDALQSMIDTLEPIPTTGSGQPTVSAPSALSPIFETEEEYVTAPGPTQTSKPKIDTKDPSTRTAYQAERESGQFARRWFLRRGLRVSSDRPNPVRRFLTKMREHS